MSSINLALIGCGGMGGAHLNALGDLKRNGVEIINLVAVCDVDRPKAEAFAERATLMLGQRPSVYGDFHEMLRGEPELDAVDIIVEHGAHHTVAVPCLEASKHVIMEKPLAITMRACKLIVEAAERNGRVLATAENYRRSPQNRAIHWAIEGGMIGEPRLLFWQNASYWLGSWGWRHDKMAAGGGWCLDGGVHYADLWLYNLGEVEEVYAVNKTLEPNRFTDWPEMKQRTPYTVEDVNMAVLKFRSGVVGQWTWTQVAPGEAFDQSIIYGTKGSVSWQKGLTTLGPGKVGVYSVSPRELQSLMMKGLDPEVKERWFPKGTTNDVAIELHDFAESILRHRKPEVDGLLGAKAEAIPMAVYESSWLGEPVKVEKVENFEIENYQREINERLNLI